ncbi:MAG: radical SAM protein [Bdellovibrionaceae bacterium]|nr:radical SAM protein [Bdellovibrionales bacterium]MCB9085711.1 radical SAM protein [Pseudobdellovibrionaceae bacterium]
MKKPETTRVSADLPKGQDVLLVISPMLYSLATGPLMAPALLKSFLARANKKAHCVDLNLELWHYLERDSSLFSLEPHPMMSDQLYAEFSKQHHIEDFVNYWAKTFIDAQAKWVGFSVHDKRTERLTKEFCRAIRKTCPEQKIIVGGSQVQYCGAPMFKEGLIDDYLVGEAEEALLALINGHPPVLGLTLAKFGEARLDLVPVSDYSDFPLQSYPNPSPDPRENIMVSKIHGGQLGLEYLFVQGSRSCIWHCDFCHVRVTKGSFRQRPADELAGELFAQYQRHGIKKFVFADNLLNANLKHLDQFCDHLIQLYDRYGVDPFMWEGFFVVRGNSQVDTNYFKKLRAAGCHRLHFGIESGSPDVRRHMGKRFSNEDLLFTLKQLKQNNLTCRLMFFVGHPFEEDPDFDQTLDLIGQLQPYRDTISHLNIGHTASVLRNSRLKNTLSNQEVFIEKDPRFGQTEFYNEFKLWRYQENTIELRVKRHAQLRQQVLDLGFNLEDPLQDKLPVIEKLIVDCQTDATSLEQAVGHK